MTYTSFMTLVITCDKPMTPCTLIVQGEQSFIDRGDYRASSSHAGDLLDNNYQPSAITR